MGNGRNRELHLLWSEGGGVALTCGRNSRRITHDMSYSPGQEISPPRFLSVAVIFSGLSLCVCVIEAVASWGNTGGGWLRFGEAVEPLPLAVTSDFATLSRPFPKQPTESAKLQDICLYLGHGHFGMCILIICRGGRGLPS